MRRHLGILLQLGVSVMFFWVLARKAEFDVALGLALQVNLGLGLMLATMVMGQFCLAAYRLKLVIQNLGHHPSMWACVKAHLIGAFVSQTPLTSLGGDAVRIWSLCRDGIALGDAARAVTIDRVFGVASLLVVILLVSFPLLTRIEDPWLRWSIMLCTAAAAAGVGGLLFLQFLPLWLLRFRLVRWAVETAGACGRMLTGSFSGGKVLGIGVAVHLFNIMVIFGLAMGLGVEITLQECIILTPFPMLLTFLPLSIGGWGVRETALVVSFGLAGVAPEKALAVSILYGLIVLLISLPGGVLLFLRASRKLSPVVTPRETSGMMFEERQRKSINAR